MHTYIHAITKPKKVVQFLPIPAYSTELAKICWQQLPVEKHDPLTHLIAECKKGKERQQRNHPITAAYVSDHLSLTNICESTS